jgi:hypothetical protein
MMGIPSTLVFQNLVCSNLVLYLYKLSAFEQANNQVGSVVFLLIVVTLLLGRVASRS